VHGEHQINKLWLLLLIKHLKDKTLKYTCLKKKKFYMYKYKNVEIQNNMLIFVILTNFVNIWKN